MSSLLEDLHERVTADAAAGFGALKAYDEWCIEKGREDGHEHDSLVAAIDSHGAEVSKDQADTENTSAEIDALIA